MSDYKLEDFDVPGMMERYNCHDEKVINALIFLLDAVVIEGALKDRGDHGVIELNIPPDIDKADVDKAYDIVVNQMWLPAIERSKAAKLASGTE